jgi:hypothetical protein
MKITAAQLRKIIAEEVKRTLNEMPMRKALGAVQDQIPDPDGLKMAMKDAYGRPKAYKQVPGNPNMVLVKDMEIPGQFFPWEYDNQYGGWNEADGPVDAMGELV